MSSYQNVKIAHFVLQKKRILIKNITAARKIKTQK